MRFNWDPEDVQALRTVQLADERAQLFTDQTGQWYLVSLADGCLLGQARDSRIAMAATLNTISARPDDLPHLPSGEPNPARWAAGLRDYMERHAC